MEGKIVPSVHSWDNNASQLEAAQFFEQRGQWTGFNGTVPRLFAHSLYLTLAATKQSLSDFVQFSQKSGAASGS